MVLAVFMLSEAVLSVERTGLPYFVVMVDDSASEQIVDQFANPKTKAAVGRPGQKSGRTEPSRLAVAAGLARSRTTRKVLRELQKQNKVRLYLVVVDPLRLLAEIDKPEERRPARWRSSRRSRPTGGRPGSATGSARC